MQYQAEDDDIFVSNGIKVEIGILKGLGGEGVEESFGDAGNINVIIMKEVQLFQQFYQPFLQIIFDYQM